MIKEKNKLRDNIVNNIMSSQNVLLCFIEIIKIIYHTGYII